VSPALLAIAVTLGAPPALEPPRGIGLELGDLLTYGGSVVEEVRRPGKESRRDHELELRVFVLERNEKWADAIVLTRIRRMEDAVGGAAGSLTGRVPRKDVPPVIRLELVRVHADGTAHLLAPAAATLLSLDDRTPARALPLVPIDSYPGWEFGIFPPRPPRDHGGEPWSVAVGPSRSNQTWQVKESKFFNAERCEGLVMNQFSPNWTHPTGTTAWHHAEAVWVSTRDGAARRVHRVILQRDGRADSPPAAWVEVKYELKEQTRLTGRAFERARRDAEIAYSAMVHASQRPGAKKLDALLDRLDVHVRETDATSPFLEALDAARRALEAARDGDPVRPLLAPASAMIPAPAQWPEAGRAAPNFRAGEFQLASMKGEPVVLVFLKPGGETTALALAVADALAKRYAGRLTIVPLVVFGEVEHAERERDRLNLTVPLFEGASAGTIYGVDTVPRFAIVDEAGRVRWTFTGIGAETGFLLREELDRLVPPTSPAAPRGITASPGSLGVPLVPPP
jgi:hypothetical protein